MSTITSPRLAAPWLTAHKAVRLAVVFSLLLHGFALLAKPFAANPVPIEPPPLRVTLSLPEHPSAAAAEIGVTKTAAPAPEKKSAPEKKPLPAAKPVVTKPVPAPPAKIEAVAHSDTRSDNHVAASADPKPAKESAAPATTSAEPAVAGAAIANAQTAAPSTAGAAGNGVVGSAAPAKGENVGAAATDSGTVPDGVPRLLAGPKPAMSNASRTRGEHGSVSLRIDVGADGKVNGVSIERSSGYTRLDDTARQTVLTRWRFAPGLHQGKPIATFVNVPVIFRLEEE